jgi:hypothetical protein
MNNSPITSGGQGDSTASDGVWSWKRRWLAIAIVFIAHVGLIFAFGDRKSTKLQPPGDSFTTSVVFDSSKLPPMANPVLFALPHRKSFAGPALVNIPAISFPSFHWTEPARFLTLPAEAFDAAFDRFARDNSVATYQFEFKPPARLAIPFVPDIKADTRTNSTVRFSDNLLTRRLLSAQEFPSQPAGPELLTNSVVRVVVGADGLTASAIQVKQPNQPPGGGAEKADRDALEYAKAMRFAPLPAGVREPTIGVMVFEWHIAPTNTPSIQR